MTVVVGVDVATAEVRATAVDAAGSLVATAARPLPPPRRPRPGWSQQRPDYADEAFAVLRKLAGQLAGRPVAGIAVSSTSGTVVPCDPAGVPVGDALLYDDRRGAPASALGTAAGPAAAPASLSAAESAHGPAEWPSALCRIGWLEKHRPAPLYLHVADVVVAALTGGVRPTDTSHALKSGADPETLRWPERLLSQLGVAPGALPELERPGVVVAEISAGAAARTALPEGAPVVLGMTDGCTGQMAAGAVTVGDAVSVLGTTLVVKAVTAARPYAHGTAVYSHRAPDGRWWPGGASNVGAGVLTSATAGTGIGAAPARPWAPRPGPAEAGLTGPDLAALDSAADRHGPARVCCYPLTRRGERFPFDRPDAEGFWTGPPRDRVEEHRALLEGVAFTERLALAVLGRAGGFGSGPLRAVGGASRSDVWLRIRATVTGRPVTVPEHPSSSFGAAVLAAASTVHGSLADAVAAMVRPARTVDPDVRQLDALESSYRRFLAALRERGHLDGDEAEGAVEPGQPPAGPDRP